MKQQQHTAGPWKITESSHKQEWSHWIESGSPSSSRLVAAIGNDMLREGSNEANARLIAAAPDLLKEAKAMLAYPFGCDKGSVLHQLMQGLAAAIAKAEGWAE